MSANVRRLFRMHIEDLQLREKLELLELLMESTLELIRKEKALAEIKEQETRNEVGEVKLTELQELLLRGPVMSEEEYELFKEKKQHFEKWK